MGQIISSDRIYPGSATLPPYDPLHVGPYYLYMELPADVESIREGLWRVADAGRGPIVQESVEAAEQMYDDAYPNGNQVTFSALVCVDEAQSVNIGGEPVVDVCGTVLRLEPGTTGSGLPAPRVMHGGRNLWRAVAGAIRPLVTAIVSERDASLTNAN